jgi:transcriptional regulator with XRE-family HTH domain
MRVQKEGTNPPKARYRAFGQRLAELRRVRRIDRQADLATLLNATQQTVSRWEAGLSRPREHEIPLLAEALGTDVEGLRRVAGYATKTVVTSFDEPFPLDALSPESFERFCANLLRHLYRGAEVNHMGARGHAQEGTDILVTLADGTVRSFQCKRTEEFGPQKVHAAIAKHTVKAKQKFLLLSRVASPPARNAVRAHKDWHLWDKDDLSAKARSLAKIDQIALVDMFFAGRRSELLGVSEEGVWETTNDFFAPFQNAGGLFNHAWKLVGREEPLSKLQEHLADDAARVVLLTGSGGSGKSRVLKQAIEAYQAATSGVTVRFLARTAELTKKSLEELGDNPALLIVDDAHDRTDLGLLLQFAAMNNRARLLLALRPYGLEHLKAQASTFSLLDTVREVKLASLTKAEAELLAKQVLEKENGPVQAAKDIANLTYDCPLATVVGAQIVAREKKHFDLAKNEDDFRSTLFGRFQSVIAGELGQRADAEPIKKLLRVVSLCQPFYLDDRALLALVETVEGIAPHDTNRLFKLLIDGGVLFKRGLRYRLSPDVLADYVIEAACVGPNGRSTGYAEKAFDAADDRLVESLLLNLGKLDWRLSNGDASNSNLLDGVWGKLRPRSEYDDPHIRAVRSIAFYQPLRAVEFGEALIRKGEYLRQLPLIFKYAAYNLQYVARACAALWELGRNDSRPLHQHPEHAIRVLSELCEVTPQKPRDYNTAVVDFGLQIAADPSAWSSHYTPLDILSAIFKTEGHTTSSHNHTITLTPFTVNPDFVDPLRNRVLDLVIELLGSSNPRIAMRAASALGEALRYPMGLFNATVSQKARDEWTKLFCATLERIESTVRQNTYDPLVLVGIAKAVSWHANYSKSDTTTYAKRVRSALSSSLDYRVLATLSDGYGTELRRQDRNNFDALWDKHLKSLAADVVASYPNGEALRSYIAAQLSHIQEGTSDSAGGSPHVLYDALLAASPSLARATLSDALGNPQSITARFAASALRIIWLSDADEARKVAREFLGSGQYALHLAVGRTLSALDFTKVAYDEEEARALRALITSDNPHVVCAGIFAIRAVLRHSADEAMTLAREVKVSGSAEVADDLLCLFGFGAELPFERLRDDDFDLFLEKLVDVPELDGHWTETFLANASKVYPSKTLEFFIQRVERAVAENSWQYRPTNHGPYVHVPLTFKDTPEYGALLARTVSWMSNASYDEDRLGLFQYRARELFEAAFGEFDAEVTQFISQWSEAADAAAFKTMANILHEAPHKFIFTHAPLVTDLLTKAQRAGGDAQEHLCSALYVSAIGGVRQGSPGQPFERDLEAKAGAEKVLESLSKFSPAYELYEQVRKSAQQEIERSHREREAYED